MSLHQQLTRRLAATLPGRAAQELMAPSVRNPQNLKHTSSPRLSAVCLLLYQKDDEWYFPLIKRNEYNGKHSAQISLPGGKYEDIDGQLAITAIRETQEEIGVQIAEHQLLGTLSSLYIPVSNFEVHPFVAISESELHFIPDNAEVQYVIEFPLRQLLDKNKQGLMDIISQGKEIKAPVYYLDKEYVWGATAMILSEFSEVLKGIEL